MLSRVCSHFVFKHFFAWTGDVTGIALLSLWASSGNNNRWRKRSSPFDYLVVILDWISNIILTSEIEVDISLFHFHNKHHLFPMTVSREQTLQRSYREDLRGNTLGTSSLWGQEWTLNLSFQGQQVFKRLRTRETHLKRAQVSSVMKSSFTVHLKTPIHVSLMCTKEEK